MRVQFTNNHGGHKAGQVVDLSDDKAKEAVKAGNAEEYENDGPARVRFRRGVTLGKTTHAAGTVDTVEQSDELWEAVNRGDADLDPAPGEKLGNGTQPFPPEWVGRDETTDAPIPPAPVAATAQPVKSPPPPANPTRTVAATAEPTPEKVGKDPHAGEKANPTPKK
jgi:hypothetical protein